MSKKVKLDSTQRAYTIRLRGADVYDTSWRKALWQTHKAVNEGAKTFGNWLLTMRGGLEHSLANTKQQRILLALSWLSVESLNGAPEKFIIAFGKDTQKVRSVKVVAALEEVLKTRCVSQDEIDVWMSDCTPSLSAAIRDDAVWVNRSLAFDAAVEATNSSLTRGEAWDMLKRFFGNFNNYIAPVNNSETMVKSVEQSKDVKNLIMAAGQWLSNRFGTGKGVDRHRMTSIYKYIADWADQNNSNGSVTIDALAAELRTHFGAGALNDASDLDFIIKLSSYAGHSPNPVHNILRANHALDRGALVNLRDKAHKRAENCRSEIGSKGSKAYADVILEDVESVCGFTYLSNKNHQNSYNADQSKHPRDNARPASRHSEFAVMLDHAARRVSLVHTWVKRAEAERSLLEDAAKTMNAVPASTKAWLDVFCSEYSASFGALESYRIRRRAVDGWHKVVAAWDKSLCRTSSDRITAARALQNDPAIDKFGDIQLFEALAEDGAVCVWHKDGDATKAPDPQPLIDYVLAAEAEFKKRQFKVPAYRHPDYLLHPIFCDFGNSRWNICFEIHKNNQTSHPRALSMTLWTGTGMRPVRMFWQSKRLALDLAIGQGTKNIGSLEVVRANRLGRAASNASASDTVKIAGIFEQADWNGRLQAPRRQLEAIAAVRDNTDMAPAERKHRVSKMINHIRWLTTFSAKLRPHGPWYGFAEKHGLNPNPQHWPHAYLNRTRKGMAKLILSRLPGLRILSVDLGHRYAAACAVWEVLSAEQVSLTCEAAGHKVPTASDIYLHLKNEAVKYKHGKRITVEETTVYRRIGPDILPGDKQHPAPWARLDRQFLIKLQGEDGVVREASNDELWKVHQLEAALGRNMPLIDRLVRAGWGKSNTQRARLEALRRMGWTTPGGVLVLGAADVPEPDASFQKPPLSVDELMFVAVRTMRLALKRHGNCARIAFAMGTDYKPMSGNRRYYFNEAKELAVNDTPAERKNKYIEFIQDALVLWYVITSSYGWRDNEAKQLWNKYIVPLPGYMAPEDVCGDTMGVKRSIKIQKDNKSKLYHVAATLVQDVTLRQTIRAAWEQRWEANDKQWQMRLRWFKDWTCPRGKSSNNSATYNVGGLSLSRISTLTEFRRQVQVGFYTRLHPNGMKTETKVGFGQKTLASLEHLREQRVKQLASRIAEAALGIGRMRRPLGGKDPKRPDVSVDEPCHAIIIEDLTHYRPEETRTRRENRQLMTWASSKVKKYLAEACQLHGLHLREVSASYTSRQDSRTGAPGVRCQDVPVKEFMRSPFWRKQITQAAKKQAEGKDDARERFLCNMNATWKDKTPADWEKAGVIRVPISGGGIFVSASLDSKGAKSLQADLNAAANIGLRALTDPDWPGKWWYVPCAPVSFRPIEDKVGGNTAVNSTQTLQQSTQTQRDDDVKGKKKRRNGGAGKPKEVVNLWRDISSSPIEDGEWKEYAAYWNSVQHRVVGTLACGVNRQQRKTY